MLLLLLVQLLEYSLSAVILKPVGFSRINPESSFARADQKKPKHRAELFEQEIDDKETKDYALELMSKQLNLPINELVVTDYHRDQFGAIHVYLARTYNGIAVSNQNAAIHLKGSRVIAVSSSIRKSQSLSKRDDHLVDLNQAIQIAVAKYGGKLDGSVTPEIVYVESETGLLLLAYKFQLKDNENLLWFQVEVAAETGQIIRVIDFYSRSSYRAAPLPRNSALDGLNTIKNPEYWGASPKGWNSDSYRNYSDTTGNNVEARITTGQKIDGGPNLEFNTIWNPAEDPILGTNPEAALINAFYICNRVHDVAYMYGFDEIAGNFQQNNFGNGGIGGDSLIVNIQGRGLNNANFATPPDGQRPIMNLYLWNYNSPRRDSALDNQIIIHEFMHGISHRLTGGPATVGCLSTLESGGMGEGWGDIFALVLTMDPGANGNSTFEMFPYVAHSVATGRLYPYSSNMTANPLTCTLN